LNGKTLTWAATTSADGEVNVCDTAAHEATNIYNAFNAPFTDITDTSGAGYDAWTEADLAGAWDGLSATNGTSGTVNVKLEGHGWVAFTESLTNATITSAKQIEHQMFGKKGAIDIVVQKKPTITIRKVSDKIGSNVIPWTMYGIKTTDAGDAELVDVKCTWA